MSFEDEHFSQLLLPQVIHLLIYHAYGLVVELAVAHLLQHWVVEGGLLRMVLGWLGWWWWSWCLLLGDAE